MVVFVSSIKEEDDRDSLARVIVMIAPVEEAIGILRVVVTRIKRYVQERLVDSIYQFA